jgi:hypothetical protein
MSPDEVPDILELFCLEQKLFQVNQFSVIFVSNKLNDGNAVLQLKSK